MQTKYQQLIEVIKYKSIIFVFVFLSACGQKEPQNPNLVHMNEPSDASTIKSDKTFPSEEVFNINRYKANQVTEIGTKVLSIIQDKANNYWFGTNSGAYFYNGKNLFVFSLKDGLFQNQILDIQEDHFGNIWFATGGYGVNCFKEDSIYTFISNEEVEFKNKWKIENEDLWFYAGAGVFRHSKDSFTYLPFPKSNFDTDKSLNSPYKGSAYGVYTILKDRKGCIWFGTQAMGVCRYDGNSFTWFTDHGLKGPAVLALFEDINGNIWFGTNGTGLYRYDGKNLTNITKEHELENPEFMKSGKHGPGSLARVWTINEDNNGDLWIGTADAGVWRYDGRNLINYTAKNGLPNCGIETIYKDKKGVLWFGTDGDGVYTYNGINFTKFIPLTVPL